MSFPSNLVLGVAIEKKEKKTCLSKDRLRQNTHNISLTSLSTCRHSNPNVCTFLFGEIFA